MMIYHFAAIRILIFSDSSFDYCCLLLMMSAYLSQCIVLLREYYITGGVLKVENWQQSSSKIRKTEPQPKKTGSYKKVQLSLNS